jgi:hypothetical protein
MNRNQGESDSGYNFFSLSILAVWVLAVPWCFMQISSFLVKCSQMMLQSAVTAHELCLQSRSLYLCICLAYQEGKDIIVFRFIIEYSSLRDFVL